MWRYNPAPTTPVTTVETVMIITGPNITEFNRTTVNDGLCLNTMYFYYRSALCIICAMGSALQNLRSGEKGTCRRGKLHTMVVFGYKKIKTRWLVAFKECINTGGENKIFHKVGFT